MVACEGEMTVVSRVVWYLVAAAAVWAWSITYREDQEHADVIEALENWDTVVTASDAAYLVKSAA